MGFKTRRSEAQRGKHGAKKSKQVHGEPSSTSPSYFLSLRSGSAAVPDFTMDLAPGSEPPAASAAVVKEGVRRLVGGRGEGGAAEAGAAESLELGKIETRASKTPERCCMLVLLICL